MVHLNRKYGVCSCLSQSENTQSKVLSVMTEFIRVYETTDPRYQLVNLYQIISNVWL